MGKTSTDHIKQIKPVSENAAPHTSSQMWHPKIYLQSKKWMAREKEQNRGKWRTTINKSNITREYYMFIGKNHHEVHFVLN